MAQKGKGLAALLKDWQMVGGTVTELVEFYREDPGAVTDLGASYDLAAEDLQGLPKANELADQVLNGELSISSDETKFEPRSAWLRRVMRRHRQEKRKLAQRLRDGEIELQDQDEETNSERFPDLLAEYEAIGGSREEFDALGAKDLLEMGVDSGSVAEDLARAAWGESDVGGSWEALSPAERAQLVAVFK